MQSMIAAILLLNVAMASAMLRGKGAGALTSNMRPEVVRSLLSTVESKWTASKDAALRNSTDDVSAFATMKDSCAKVVVSIIAGSNGEKDRVVEYMQDVCSSSQSNFASAVDSTDMCMQFAKGIESAMTDDEEYNRENLDTDKFCRKFWDGSVAAAAEAEEKQKVEEEAKQAKAEKQMKEQEAKVAEEEQKKEQEASAERKAKKAKLAAEQPKEQTANQSVAQAPALNSSVPVATVVTSNATVAEKINATVADTSNTSVPVVAAVVTSNATVAEKVNATVEATPAVLTNSTTNSSAAADSKLETPCPNGESDCDVGYKCQNAVCQAKNATTQKNITALAVTAIQKKNVTIPVASKAKNTSIPVVKASVKNTSATQK